MKKLSILSILLALAASASAQNPAPSQTFIAPHPKKTHKAGTPPSLEHRQPQGALQRGARGGNVLQMLNPKAPPQYGQYSDSLIIDETGKWRGIRFYEIVF